MAKSKDYFDLGWLVSVILAIIPVTSWLLGILTRVKEKNFLAVIVRLFLGFNLIWVLDLLCIVFKKSIFRLF